MDHFNDDEIRAARFVLRHKELGKRGLVFVIFFAAVTVVAVLAFQWLSFAGGFGREQRLDLQSTFQYIPFAQIREQSAPQEIVVTTKQFVPIGEQKGDVVAILSNPNDQWIAEKVVYEIFVDGVGQGEKAVFVLPTAQKYIFEFNRSTQSAVPSVDITIIDTSWVRVRDASRLQRLSSLVVEDIVSENNFELDQFEVSGTLINDAGYGFWSLGMPIIVSRQDRIIGVHYITLDMVEGFDRRPFAASWPTTLSSAETVTVIPDVNVFDDRVYMAPGTNAGLTDPSGIDGIPRRR